MEELLLLPGVAGWHRTQAWCGLWEHGSLSLVEDRVEDQAAFLNPEQR